MKPKGLDQQPRLIGTEEKSSSSNSSFNTMGMAYDTYGNTVGRSGGGGVYGKENVAPKYLIDD